MGNVHGYLTGPADTSYQPVLQKSPSALSLLEKNAEDFRSSLRNAVERIIQQENTDIQYTSVTYTLVLCPVFNPVTQVVDMHFVNSSKKETNEGTFKTEAIERTSDAPISLLDSLMKDTSVKPILPFLNDSIRLDNTHVQRVTLISATNPYNQELSFSLLPCGSKSKSKINFKLPAGCNGMQSGPDGWPSTFYKNKIADLFPSFFFYKRTLEINTSIGIEPEIPSLKASELNAFIAQKTGKRQGMPEPAMTSQQIEDLWQTLSIDCVVINGNDYILSERVLRLIGNKLDKYLVPKRFIPEDMRTDESFYLLFRKDVRRIQEALKMLSTSEQDNNILNSTLIYNHEPVTGAYFKQQIEALSYPIAKKKEGLIELDHLSSPRNLITLTFLFNVAMIDTNLVLSPITEKEDNDSSDAVDELENFVL